ncbi:hypothetical protein HYH03_003153 [Edaphochlamys debaryana]|uniref:Prefoldin subunit 5 n=1 Tax=Edaphochlamys debaryana TaxID=47281 RepID=A0A835YHX4_9CHLO|nr:hypothetical protein HYH03_003153 [Edaphochlamys debaryana]|eukprot:KAG2498965.1 hypothetical protein HYH03_003153 [Edaphochlamys debaryana]
MPPAAAETVKLDSLSLQQLNQARQDLNQEIERLGQGGRQLQRAAEMFEATKKSVEKLGASKKGQSIMLPLTSSLYVSGEVDDVEKVLVDVGTGYFVEMSISDACAYYDRRIASLVDNIGTVSNTLRQRQQGLMQVQAVFQEKLMAAQAQAAAQARA